MTLIHLASGIHPSTLERDGLKVVFRDHVNLPDRLEDLIDRLVEPDPNARFATPRQALEFLEHEAPAPVESFGPAIGEVLAKRQVAEQRAEEKAIAARRVEIMRRAKRATVRTTKDEILLEVKPRIMWWIPLPIAAFLIVNPGVFMVDEFFLGQFWPIFAENLLGRWLVWGMFIVSMAFALTKFFAPPTRLRLDRNGHFMLYNRSPKHASELGKFTNISVTLHADAPGEEPTTATVELKDGARNTVLARSFADLSPDDARLIDSVARWEGFGEPEVTLFDGGTLRSG
jgi:hypothetical protein